MGFLLFLVIPLLIFVVVDTYASLNIALAVAVLFALAEFAYSYWVSGTLDSFSIFSLFLLVILGGLSYFQQSRKMFYLKPAILSFAMSVYLLICYYLGQDVFLDFMDRMQPIISEEQWNLLQQPQVQRMLQVAPMTLGYSLFVHGLLSTYAALKLKRWAWFMIAGIGGYVFIFIAAVSASLLAVQP